MEQKIKMMSTHFAIVSLAIWCCQLSFTKCSENSNEISDVEYVSTELDKLPFLTKPLQFEKKELNYDRFVDKSLQKIIKGIFYVIKYKIREIEPFLYHFNESASIVDLNFKFDGFFQNATVNYLSHLQLTNIKSLIKNKTLSFQFKVPKIEWRNTTYKLDSRYYDIKVNGSGFFNTSITGLDLDINLTYAWKNHSLHIDQLFIHYSLDKFEISISGLNVPVALKGNLNLFLSTMITKYLKEEQEDISERIAKEIKTSINNRLKFLSTKNKILKTILRFFPI